MLARGFDKYILKRLREFETLGKKGKVTFKFNPFTDLILNATIKTELAFCISTANSSALSGLKFQKKLENPSVNILSALREAGVRFYNRKKVYIKEAFSNFDKIIRALELESKAARRELLKVKGLGMKEASHFLRNIGRQDIAIVDRHILRWLAEKEYIEKITTMTERKYVKIEKTLSEIAEELDCSLAELDLRIWAEMTGKVLK
ncbi:MULTISPECIES: N-glycosylase/DNA lyase [unclassified Archaeoglobus]|jgi:N-glycosylase/DNA lyase|uniref:N-glycosylase/DNA lyase n=1 Tax=unclassified Archaeoglobus TaxID=2643606 RepID=UPI0025BC609F|nr:MULTISPECIES: N-glycosylase/DNA lyase [unclassified Archaeoglobus]